MSHKRRGLVIYQDQKQPQHSSGQSISSLSWSATQRQQQQHHHHPLKQQGTNSFTKILSKSYLQQDAQQDNSHLPISSLVLKQQQQRKNTPSQSSGPPLPKLVQDSQWTSSTIHRPSWKQEKQPKLFYHTDSRLVSQLHSSVKDLDTIIQTHKPRFDTIIHDLSHTIILSSNELLIKLPTKDAIILHSRTPIINAEWLRNKLSNAGASLVIDSKSFLILCNNIKWYLHWKFI
ncbi:hypothetical protein SEUBUCD646_0I00280 [Saccharomyces eubayanus]|uniref:BRCT domain-containing protein n=1 Tax=Saccharomyces eubayanus TaxID=1080349 RepID=A0ABN8VUT1_SACEU|nr:hypothetical protein SEUBUCD650_0I00280 [Saccharomyces eubayanus]CAI2047375.1 hypothetical protein SEUBUCD646_0I00280 [Saccharomyces eubayanus]